MKDRIAEQVRFLLENNQQARENDQILYALYVDAYCEFPVDELWRHMVDGKAPSYDTIGRVRRKLQANHPSLRPSRKVQLHRQIAEKGWGEWAIN